MASPDIVDSLKRIWSAALEKPVQATDVPFFSLGGDSLSAMICVSRIRQEFGVSVPIEHFFLPTSSISELSIIVQALQSRI